MTALLNALGFQLVWMCAVGGAAAGYPWAGPAALLAFLALQLPQSRWPRADMILLVVAAGAGFMIDSLWLQLDLMEFVDSPGAAVAPVWIVALWGAFALTLNHSLSTLKRHPALAALLGLAGGPLAYWVACHVWKAVHFDSTTVATLVALGLAWALATPLLLLLASRLVAHEESALQTARAQP